MLVTHDTTRPRRDGTVVTTRRGRYDATTADGMVVVDASTTGRLTADGVVVDGATTTHGIVVEDARRSSTR
eukprot:scaffold38173_cov26-Tisochrysis_lutea.AAC.1